MQKVYTIGGLFSIVRLLGIVWYDYSMDFANEYPLRRHFPRLTHQTQWLVTRPSAHRGLHANHAKRPENSLAAFEAAAEAGLPIELDVQLSADEKLFVIHDEDLERLTGQPGLIWNFSSEKLRELRLLDTNEKIPTLQEVFELVRGRVPILIEIKNIRNTRRIDSVLLDAVQTYDGPIAIESFNILSIAWFRRNAPEIPRGVLVSDFKDIKVVGLLKRLLVHVILHHSLVVWFAHPHFVAYELKMLPCMAARITKFRKKPVISWTIRTASERAQAKKHSDNYIFERF